MDNRVVHLLRGEITQVDEVDDKYRLWVELKDDHDNTITVSFLHPESIEPGTEVWFEMIW